MLPAFALRRSLNKSWHQRLNEVDRP